MEFITRIWKRCSNKYLERWLNQLFQYKNSRNLWQKLVVDSIWKIAKGLPPLRRPKLIWKSQDKEDEIKKIYEANRCCNDWKFQLNWHKLEWVNPISKTKSKNPFLVSSIFLRKLRCHTFTLGWTSRTKRIRCQWFTWNKIDYRVYGIWNDWSIKKIQKLTIWR